MSEENTWIQTAADWVVGAIASILTFLTGVLMWNFRRTIAQVDHIQRSYASREELHNLESKMKDKVSRAEFIQTIEEMRDDKQRMHEENLQATRDVRSEIQEMRKEQGAEIRAVHERVDQLLRNSNSR